MFVYQKRFPTFLLLIFFILKISGGATAQCVSTFPYSEDFESSDGGWTPGGIASDWAWGTPTKQVISGAGSGSKCWIAGTLNNNSYNDNENSWLQSPCFDFTNIQLPYVSFLVNWDTEFGYDGAALQYSTDNGATWQSAGDYNDVSDCQNTNWFNASGIKYGFQPNGWSGSGTNGSGGWVEAKHTFAVLAGKKNVTFRFGFGAGKINNNYNGFAVDNIYIGEAPLNGLVSFYYTCNDASTVTFTPFQNSCVFKLQWNFGDPASGTNNIADGSVLATHIFSSTGNYQVTLSGLSNANAPVSSTLPVTISNITTIVLSPIMCNGMTGKAEAKLSNGDATNSQFYWNTTPEINAATATLKAGYYIITGTMLNGCANSSTVTLSEPAPLQHTLQTTSPDCNNSNGSITINETGGLAPYHYTWLPSITDASSASLLSAGNYSISVMDKNLCTDAISLNLTQLPSTLSHTIETTNPDCGSRNGFIQINETGGSPNYVYEWTPSISNADRAANISSGNYTVIIGDEKQCKDTAFIQLENKPFTASLGRDTVVCKGQTITLQTSNSYASYLWDNGSTMPVREVSQEGNYTVTVTNEGGCTAKDTIHVSSGCGDLIFPSGFTPNGDGKNDLYGPTGGFSLVKNYRLVIYNRLGNIIFQSNNPYLRWNGLTSGGQKLSGTYVYFATYDFEGTQKVKKGTITLLL